MTFDDWIQTALTGETSEEGFFFLARRGMSDPIRRGLEVNSWHPPEEPCPDPVFAKSFGERGEKLRDCLVFPYRDPTGKLILLEFRHLREKRIFKHSVRSENHAYFGGVPWMMPRLWGGATPILVEGFFDLTALARVYGGPVLSAGTANLNAHQIQFLRRWCSGVMLAFDNDPPGRRGQLKVGRELQRQGMQVYEMTYTGYKDPGVVWDCGGQDLLMEVFGHLLPVRN